MTPEIKTIPLLHLASGDCLTLQLYRFIGDRPGKKVYLQANLHGAELTGNVVIQGLINWLHTLEATQLTGEIWLVPVCNPLGTNQRAHHFSSGRFNPYDGKDWNRIFWDCEKGDDVMSFAEAYRQADLPTIQQAYRQHILDRFTELKKSLQAANSAPFSEQFRFHLQSLCLDADYLIDLHTSSSEGLDYLYYFPRREASAAFFKLPIALLLDQLDGDAFDEAFINPWLALEACFAKLGRPLVFDIEAWTLELGSAMQLNPGSIAKGLDGVQNYLIQKGVITWPAAETGSAESMQWFARSAVCKYYAPTGGMIQSRIALGSRVKAGERLYQILQFNKQGKLPIVVDIYAEQAGLVFDRAVNQAVNQGEYVLGLLTIDH